MFIFWGLFFFMCKNLKKKFFIKFEIFFVFDIFNMFNYIDLCQYDKDEVFIFVKISKSKLKKVKEIVKERKKIINKKNKGNWSNKESSLLLNLIKVITLFILFIFFHPSLFTFTNLEIWNKEMEFYSIFYGNKDRKTMQRKMVKKNYVIYLQYRLNQLDPSIKSNLFFKITFNRVMLDCSGR